MVNRFRLSSSSFEREEDADRVPPKKIFFISIEGNNTENEYLQGVSNYRDQLGINIKVDVEVLQRSDSDTNSAPKYVIELLEEYINLRKTGIENLTTEIPQELIRNYGIDRIEKFVYSPLELSEEERNSISTDLTKIGYDISYRKYLLTYDNDIDEFGILIDRDAHCHPEKQMKQCVEHCLQKNYQCYIANPCFEFWLLLHFCDVLTEYENQLEDIKINKKVSRSHTYVSKLVSDKAGHGKSKICFKDNYLYKVDLAVERAKKFPSEPRELIDNVGCNLWKLIEKMKNYK